MRSISSEQAALLAGFLEADGSFIISSMRKKYYGVRIAVTQKERTTLATLERMVSIGYITKMSPHGVSINPQYRWIINNSQDIISLIQKIWPHLFTSRTKKRAWCVYQIAKIKSENNGRKYSLLRSIEMDRINEFYQLTRTHKSQL